MQTNPGRAISNETKASSCPRMASWSTALALLDRALKILDDSHAPGEIGAGLDLARCQLQAALHSRLAEVTVGKPE